MEKYNHRERLELILAGEKPDRFAASFWRHYFHLENNAVGTAEAMLGFQREFDWDFMKINPRADYHVQDWGLKLEYSRSELEKHKKLSFPIQTPEDWRKIEPLPCTAPTLAEHLKVVSLIRRGAGKELPLLMTVFTPLSLAGRMVPSHQMLIDHLHTAPDLVKSALRAITETYVKYASELRNAGADGLFYATTHWASEDKLSWDEYTTVGVPYDQAVIEATGDDAMNLLHVCAGNNYLKQLAVLDYRSVMYNWDSSDPTNLPIDLAFEHLPGKTVVGGVDDKGWLMHSTPKEIAFKIDEMKATHDASRLILGPDCAIAPETPVENLKAIRERL
jgi:uroporphyrinogen decarboxylase